MLWPQASIWFRLGAVVLARSPVMNDGAILVGYNGFQREPALLK